MAGSRVARQVTRTIVALMVAAAVLLGGAATVDAQEDAATDQRVVKLVGTYDVQPDRGRIEVVEEITVSNVRGSRRSGNTITSYFWTGHTIWVPTDAEGLSIQVEGTELEWEVAETVQGIDIIAADYRRNLNFGQTRVIDVTYSLPTYEPGAGARRLNGAFFVMDMVTCCGFEEVDLTVAVPTGFDVVPPSNLRFDSSIVGGKQEFTFTDNEVTGQFTELILTDWSGFNDAGMERATASVGGTSVELIFPPDDGAWADATGDELAELGTALEELIGAPLVTDTLVLRQGRDDDFDKWGFAGPFTAPVTIPRDYDRHGLAATLAQAWLADGPLNAGTLRDGLAYDYAAEAIARTGGNPAAPTAPTGSGALGPAGSQWLMRQVSDEIGYDGLADLLRMARDSETAYVGDGDPESVATIPNDWRRFLDLAQRRLGSEQVGPVLEEHVLGQQSLAALQDRSSALSRYETLATATGAPLPVGIRTALTNWDFDRAEALLDRAQEVAAERDRVVGDDVERRSDAALALGQEWASAETVEDLEAVRASILDRESELDRGNLIRLALIGLGVLILAGAIVGGFLLRRRRSSGPNLSDPTASHPALSDPAVSEPAVSHPAVSDDPGTWAPPTPVAEPGWSNVTTQLPAPVAAPVMPPTAQPPTEPPVESPPAHSEATPSTPR